MSESSITITDEGTRAFLHGVGVGSEIATQVNQQRDAATEPIEHEALTAFYWLFVGLNADREIVGAHQEQFLAGAKQRAPQRHEQFTIVIDTSNDAFHGEDEEDSYDYRADQVEVLLSRLLGHETFTYGDHGSVLDTNGNSVGEWRTHD